jgi:uncharacterized membrane protein
MNQLFVGIIVVLGLGGYWLYQENITLKANNYILESAVEEQKAAMDAIRASFEKQTNALQNMTRANAEIEAEKAEYLQIFARHNLNSLAVAKPGLIETRINKGTDTVFEEITNDTKALYELNSPSTSN